MTVLGICWVIFVLGCSMLTLRVDESGVALGAPESIEGT
jgi:hypothetical protein